MSARGWRPAPGARRPSLVSGALGVVLLLAAGAVLLWGVRLESDVELHGTPVSATVTAVRPWYWGPLRDSVVVAYDADGSERSATVVRAKHSASHYRRGRRLTVIVLDNPRVVRLPTGETSKPLLYYVTLLPFSLSGGVLLYAAIAGLQDGWRTRRGAEGG